VRLEDLDKLKRNSLTSFTINFSLIFVQSDVLLQTKVSTTYIIFNEHKRFSPFFSDNGSSKVLRNVVTYLLSFTALHL
jgi:hypothetical protein